MAKSKIKQITSNEVTFINGSTYPMNQQVKKFSSNFKEGDIVEVTIDKEEKCITFMKKITSNTNTVKTEAQIKKELGYAYLNGKWYATLEVLLNKAHEVYHNNFSIKTELIEHNFENKFAVFKAIVEVITNEGNTLQFQATGDAFPLNLGAMVKNAYIRMAETRAIVRALRLATNIAEASVEELGEEDKTKSYYNNKYNCEEVDLSEN